MWLSYYFSEYYRHLLYQFYDNPWLYRSLFSAPYPSACKIPSFRAVQSGGHSEHLFGDMVDTYN